MKIILGSSSRWRKKVFESFGLPFTTMSPDIDEKAIRFDDPERLTLAIANAKADALIRVLTEPVILVTSDQVVVCHSKILEKPANADEVRTFLRGYRDVPVETVTAVVVTNTKLGLRKEGVDHATVWFKPFPDTFIEERIKEGTIFAASGAFVLDPPFDGYVMKVEGERESIEGMPRALTLRLIQEAS